MVKDLDAAFSALADPTRRLVVDLLKERPRRASDLAAASGTSASAMSRHLRVLRTTGLVETRSPEEDTRVRMYRLRPEAFVALQAWLDQVQAFWSEQLGSFKSHTERTRSAGSARPRRTKGSRR
jgi:DNA-binding transcriptional ArsR family regulator